MIDPEHYNNPLLGIYNDVELNKLVLLKGRIDCTLYIELVDLKGEFSLVINVADVFVVNNYYKETSIDNRGIITNTGVRNFSYNKYQNIISSYRHDFIMINSVYAFDVNLNSNLIILGARCVKYKVDHSGVISKCKGDKYHLILDFDGKICFLREIVDWKEWGDIYETNFLKFLDAKTIVTGGKSEEDKLMLWDISENEHHLTDILYSEIELNDDDSIQYEYIGSFALHKRNRLIAIEFENPTYGQDCIKILKIGLKDELTTIFKYSFQDYRLLFIAFEPDGDEFAILEFTKFYEYSLPNVSIRIYSINGTHIPRKTISTNLNYHSTFIREICYFLPEILAIITTDMIFLYSVTSGEEISVLRKDIKRPYCISNNRMFYMVNQKLMIFTIEKGELPQFSQDEYIPINF